MNSRECFGIARFPRFFKKKMRGNLKFLFFDIFSMSCWPKSVPGPLGSPADHPYKVWTSPDHSRRILHRFYNFRFSFCFVGFCKLFDKVYIFCRFFQGIPWKSLEKPMKNLQEHTERKTKRNQHKTKPNTHSNTRRTRKTEA